MHFSIPGNKIEKQRTVGVGIIGLGFMGYTHYNVYKKHPNARVVALCDRNPDRRNGQWDSVEGNMNNGHGCTEVLDDVASYAEAQDLINDPRVELVDICLRTDLHRRIAIDALEKGKHVLLEKPIAGNLEDAQMIVDVAHRATGYMMVAHCIRFWPPYSNVHQMISRGDYGAIHEVILRRHAPVPAFGDGNWFLDGTISGGAQLDLHIHDIDYANYLLGLPERIYAWGETGASGAIDCIHASLGYANGSQATIIGAWTSSPSLPFNMEFTIRCDRAFMEWSHHNCSVLKIHTEAPNTLIINNEDKDGYEVEIDTLLRCIINQTPPTNATADDALNALRVIDAETRSIMTGLVTGLDLR